MSVYKNFHQLWQKSHSYFLILGGTGARMAAALAYFLLLVNIMPLEEYGLFVSILASALIISNGGTYGFLAPAFRAQTQDNKDADAYLGSLLLYAILWIPLTIALGYGVHLLFFAKYTTIQTVLTIILAEAILMRVLDSIYDLNIAKNRYGMAALINIGSILPRVGAALLFMTIEDKSLANWANYFLMANIVAFLISLALMPRLKVRLNLTTFRTGLKEAFSLEGVNFIQSLQMELDKLLVLTFAGPTAAGIYSLSMRIIYVINEPVRSLFPLVAKFFIKDTSRIRSLANQVKFEAGLILSSSLAYLSLILLLSIAPSILGKNVEAGYEFFSMLPMVFALKLLPEYHKTVLYGAELLHRAFIIALGLTITKGLIIYYVASQTSFATDWLLPLNLLYGLLYIQSLWATWGWAIDRKSKKTEEVTQES